MQDSAVDEILERVRDWSMADLQALRDDLEAILRRRERTEPLCSVREFRGIGHGTWTDVGGVDEFIKQERASWEGPGRAISELQAQTQYSILDFEGVAHGTWDEVGGVDAFIKQERASWDDASKHTSGRREQAGQSITELRGAGKEFWQGIDVEEYIRQERASWDV